MGVAVRGRLLIAFLCERPVPKLLQLLPPLYFLLIFVCGTKKPVICGVKLMPRAARFWIDKCFALVRFPELESRRIGSLN